MCRSASDGWLGTLFLGCSLLAVGPARATETTSSAAPVTADETIYLFDVRVNGWPLGLVAQFFDDHGRLALPADQYEGLGFLADPHFVSQIGSARRVYLDQVPGLHWTIDMPTQSIDISAPFALLKTNAFAVAPGVSRVASRADWGALFSYDVFGQWSPKSGDPLFARAISSNFEGRLFSPWFTARTSGLFSAGEGTAARFTRLETTIDFDDPDHSSRLRLGDSYTNGPVWVRPLRFGGVQWSRDFSLRPDIVTTPVATIGKDIAVPSTVDLFVNGVRRYAQAVNPGPLRLDDLPVAAGANQISLVVTDQAGRRTEMTLPFYSAGNLLAQGMIDFDVEAGASRQNYSVKSNDYSGGFASGVIGKGVSDSLTLRGYAAGARNYWGAGAGATLAIGNAFVVDGALLYADDRSSHGPAFYLGVGRTARRLTLSAAYGYAKHYADLAEHFGYYGYENMATASLGWNLGRAGQLNFVFARQTNYNRQISSVASGNYGIDLSHHRIHASLSGYAALRGGGWGAVLSGTITFGPNVRLYAQQSWRDGRRSGSFELDGESKDNRLDWQVEGYEGETNGAAAQANWEGRIATLYGRAAHVNGSTGLQGEFSQTLIIMDKQLFVTGPVDDGFTIVDVAGSPHVKVALENRNVGRTNASGRLLVPGLQSYAPNSLSIDPLDLPVDASIARTTALVAPRSGAGMITQFAVQRQSSALVALVLPDGKPPPVGAEAHLAGNPDMFVVGYGGEVYVRGIVAGRNRIDVSWTGHACSASFSADVAAGSLPRLGPFACVS